MKSIPEKTPLLIVDDDEILLMSLRAALTGSGMPKPAVLSDPQKVMELIGVHRFHVILLDLIMPEINGIEILKKIKEKYPDIECIIITAVDDVTRAVEAMQFGAFDYLVKPLSREKLIITINNALDKHHLRTRLNLYDRPGSFSDLENPEAFRPMVASDNAMADVFYKAQLFAESDYNIFISGETGVGKEMLARIVHNLSQRSKGPFVAVNMASFSSTLFEDELFGHSRGAFTGAAGKKHGFIEEARGGTLFLDEITELSGEFQAKILRVIQEREFYLLGSTEKRKIDLRFISATNLDIHAEIDKGKFRKDLFYRLNICHIKIPPLRERKADILPLAHHFLKKHAEINNKTCPDISKTFEAYLLSLSYPGNVRELENIMSAVVISGEKGIHEFNRHEPEEPIFEPIGEMSGNGLLHDIEKKYIVEVMDRTGGNQTRAAKILGISTRTLQRKLKAYENI